MAIVPGSVTLIITNMASNRGWWSLELKGNIRSELTMIDLEHIANLIMEGFIEGEICEDEPDPDAKAWAEMNKGEEKFESKRDEQAQQ